MERMGRMFRILRGRHPDKDAVLHPFDRWRGGCLFKLRRRMFPVSGVQHAGLRWSMGANQPIRFSRRAYLLQRRLPDLARCAGDMQPSGQQMRKPDDGADAGTVFLPSIYLPVKPAGDDSYLLRLIAVVP